MHPLEAMGQSIMFRYSTVGLGNIYTVSQKTGHTYYVS